MQKIAKFSSFAAGVVAGVTLWGTMVERHLPVLKNVSLPLLPLGSENLRVLHLSDFHLAPWQNKKREWISALANLNPDLVVFTGDFFGHKNSLPEIISAILPFKGTPGAFVYGSNDYYAPVLKNPVKYLKEPSRLGTKVPDLETAALTNLLENQMGFKNLNNNSTVLKVSETEILLQGLGDPHISYDDKEKLLTSLENLTQRETAVLKLGLVHAPYKDALNVLLEADSDLIFSGHTHGGQVRVPGVGALTSNSDLPLKQAAGLSVWHKQNKAAFLHVSAGLGTSIYAPVRVACRPEATLITITAKDFI